MENSKTLKMIQVSKHKWRLEANNGTVLVEDLILDSAYRAEEYALNYASSFQGWKIELKPMKERK